jgi:4-hydroxyphenylpyruvate dioxygenase
MTRPFKLLGFDHIGFIVGNAKQATQYYESTLGFNRIAYRGLETGERNVTSYALRQNDIIFVLNTPLGSSPPLNDHLRRHGDGVRDIAFGVDDAKLAWEHTTSRGATSFQEPTTQSDEHGEVITAAIKTYGDTVHTFVQRGDYQGPFMPGFQKVEPIVKQDRRSRTSIRRSLVSSACGRWMTRMFPPNSPRFARSSSPMRKK